MYWVSAQHFPLRCSGAPGSAGPPVDLFVGDITSYTLHNLQPGTTHDVRVEAQYTGGKSEPLAGQGTTREDALGTGVAVAGVV